jgi:S1-C subfamily serine protease
MAVMTDTKQSQGYALPVGQVRDALAGLRTGDQTDSIGAELTPIGDMDLAELFRNDSDFSDYDPERLATIVKDYVERNDVAGLYISTVADNSPASGNVYYGDMITEANGVRVSSVKDLCGVLGSAGTGDSVSLSGIRINALGPDSVFDTWSATVQLG